MEFDFLEVVKESLPPWLRVVLHAAVSLGFVPLQRALVLASTCLKVSDCFVAMFWLAILRWDQCKRHYSALSADGMDLCVKRIDGFESHQAIVAR